mgnify:FL=1
MHIKPDEILLKIAELEDQIANLPIGSLSTKTVNGNLYYYHRWYENRKRKEQYILADEVPALQEQIEQRKALEAELKMLRKKAPRKKKIVQPEA